LAARPVTTPSLRAEKLDIRISPEAKRVLHATSFDCGNEALNPFIKLHAVLAQRAGMFQIYVAAMGHGIRDRRHPERRRPKEAATARVNETLLRCLDAKTRIVSTSQSRPAAESIPH